MKVALKDIKPNPWRHIDKGYPINSEKVAHLQDSIKNNGFWGGLVARKAKTNGYYEIAFGHHRLAALRKEHGSEHEIEIPIRELTDAQMLQFMAAENDTLDIMSPAIINETVKAAMEFLKEDLDKLAVVAKLLQDHSARTTKGRTASFDAERRDIKKTLPEHLQNVMERADKKENSSKAQLISEFLRWPQRRVSEAMTAIGLPDKELAKEYESMPTQSVAETYRREITKTPLTAHQRKPIVQKIVKQEIGTRQIRQEILNAKFPLGKPKKTKIDIDDVADQITKHVLEATVLMTPEFMASCGEVSGGSLQRLSRAVNAFIGKLRQVKNGKQLLIGGVAR